jgi:uncharacterized protein (TIGR02118 family)
MLTVLAIYPTTPSGRFDMDYYINQHMSMLIKLAGPLLVSATVDQGLAGLTPGSPAPNCVIARLVFESQETLDAFFAQHAPTLMADIPNFTDIEPVLQINQVLYS